MAIVDHGQFFSREELQCRCGECGYLCKMDEAFMMYLEELREKFSKPLYLSSGFRCPAHNRKVSSSGSPNGPHTTGKAVDILIANKSFVDILPPSVYFPASYTPILSFRVVLSFIVI